MRIVCNGMEREVAPGTLLADFIRQLGLEVETVVAECDGRILRREEYDTHELHDGAVVELIRFVGGG